MKTALSGLKQVLDLIQPLPEAEWIAFSAVWKPYSAKRKEIITAAGEVESTCTLLLREFSGFIIMTSKTGKRQ